jgi:hypothetical protein
MPERDFEIWIDETTRILVSRTTAQGALISFAVILMVYHGDSWIDIGRYDTAHGIPHQDVLHRRKLAKKIWFDDLSPKEVFAQAIENYRKNHALILHDYLA